MEISENFWEHFSQKKFGEALNVFEKLDTEEKQKVLAQLFQKSQCSQTPHSVSVLFRRLHEGKEFDDFYRAWFPPEEQCQAGLIDGQNYQQYFKVPIRVLNAINLEDPTEIVSIGLHWMTDEELEFAMNDPEFAKAGAERGQRIAEVADKEQTGVYKVVSDDNLGTAF